MNLKERIELVNERINFIKELSEVRDHFRGQEKILKTKEGTWTHSYKHFSALRIYLALTCFDILGQSDDWIDFNGWLRSKSKTDERNKIFEKHKLKNLQQILISVNNDYNKQYGVKTSFFRFIRESLTTENQQKLFKSIAGQKRLTDEIVKDDGTKIAATGTSIELTQKQKEEFLLNIRNSFTHKGISIGDAAGGVFEYEQPILFPISENKWEPRWIHMAIHHQKVNNSLITFKVQRWPFVLLEIIKDTVIRLTETYES